jgi:hypothetical protein
VSEAGTNGLASRAPVTNHFQRPLQREGMKTYALSQPESGFGLLHELPLGTKMLAESQPPVLVRVEQPDEIGAPQLDGAGAHVFLGRMITALSQPLSFLNPNMMKLLRYYCFVVWAKCPLLRRQL